MSRPWLVLSSTVQYWPILVTYVKILHCSVQYLPIWPHMSRSWPVLSSTGRYWPHMSRSWPVLSSTGQYSHICQDLFLYPANMPTLSLYRKTVGNADLVWAVFALCNPVQNLCGFAHYDSMQACPQISCTEKEWACLRGFCTGMPADILYRKRVGLPARIL